jgi:predicted AAA+ superfamily ATPase
VVTRALELPSRSFFLFGPRGTGKTTWLRAVLPGALWFDLLRTHVVLELSRQPQAFRQQVDAQPRGQWIVIDEVQRLPSLLNEVHAALVERPGAWRFALSGSSARKLRRPDVNLLAGRAVNRQCFPLTAAEIGAGFDLDRASASAPCLRCRPSGATRPTSSRPTSATTSAKRSCRKRWSATSSPSRVSSTPPR